MSLLFVLTPAKLSALGTQHRRPLQICPSLRRPVARRPIVPAKRSPSTPCMSLLPLIPNWLVIAAWAFGAYRFYLGFNRTSYQSSFRIPLALAWPLLVLVNTSYRKNFVRSIRAASDD